MEAVARPASVESAPRAAGGLGLLGAGARGRETCESTLAYLPRPPGAARESGARFPIRQPGQHSARGFALQNIRFRRARNNCRPFTCWVLTRVSYSWFSGDRGFESYS